MGVDAITTKDLSVGFIGKQTRKLISHLNLSLKAGSTTALLGRNGSGKSTLIRTLAGLQPPLQGEVRYGERPIGKLNQVEVAKWVSVVFSKRIIPGGMTVKELVMLGRIPHLSAFASPSTHDISLVDEALEQLDITHLADREITHLSDGELQRTMLARAFAQDTRVILLDEPAAFLDIAAKTQLSNILKGLAKNTNRAIFFSSHDLALALATSDQLLLLDEHDENYWLGSPVEALKTKQVRDLLGNQQVSFDLQENALLWKIPLK